MQERCREREGRRSARALVMRVGALLLGGVAGMAAAEGDFPGVEQLMNDTELRESGVHRLTDEERAALNAWLLRYTAGEADVLKRTSDTVREAMQNSRVEAAVTGDFEGWSGKTLFYLDNGQVWRQRLSGRFRYRGDERDVVIESNSLGFHRLTHVASGRNVGVSRVR
ncbi:hypothetical protein [Chromatocurvus halotolerans]|uniref:Uncharacterized protein n=1 Tax=Chromatocurvus halotolerans TaxID=1132028 RepID=A0A4R2KYH0_9GAMM|nr:hypothetical protein [Chromatocurvus halotolerans]TCO75328.1 hypothetical protein EV688_10951 [Chromatocurvus halotolerans]